MGSCRAARQRGPGDQEEKAVPPSRRSRSVVLVSALVAAAILAIAAVPSAPAAPAAGPGRLSVGVEVLRFAGAGRSITATGLVTARLTDNAGRTQTVRTTVA